MTREQWLDDLRTRYGLVEVLSTKNDCKVLRLRHRQTGRDLVVRSFPRHLDAYEQLVKIRCQNLPQVWDAIDLEDGQVVLEEYIPGMTVDQVMLTGKYRKQGVRHVMASLCHAMGVLHNRGLVHRDIKPENIIISDEGHVVLIDFNASRSVGEGSRDTVVMGTVGYVAPEQLGLSQTDGRADIYAAGVLYNVMLTGQHPSVEIARGKAGRIVRKCTALNPDERYQTAEALLRAL